MDAVLICNTYHELSNPELMLDHVFLSLRPGGRLVVVDRGTSLAAEHSHEVPMANVESELRQKGFKIVSQDNDFIERGGDDPWWLLVAQKPQA